MKKLTDILENKNVILDENSDASLENLLSEAEGPPPENTDVGIVLSRLSDMISMSDDLYDTASSLEEIDKETAEAVEVTYNSLDELYAMFDDKYDIFRSDFDMGDIEMDEDFRISLDDLLNEATDELSEAFLRLPGHFINNELYGVERDLNTFIKGLQNGNDVNMKELNNIIKILQSAKKEVKKFNKPEEVPVSFQYKKESIEEATRRSQVLTDLFHSLAQVEIQLRPNSTIHRMVEKKAGGNYTAEFKKMKKLVDPLVKMWGDIEMDLDTDHPRESIEEAKMSPEDTKLAQEIIKSEDEKVSVTYGQKLKVARQKLIKKYGKDWAKMVESINEAGRGDWVVVDLNTKKVTYVKSYDAASKYVKKNGGVIASAEYYVDNKKKFESVELDQNEITEAKAMQFDDWMFYTDFQKGKYDNWVKRNKTIVTKWVKLNNDGEHVFFDKKVTGSDKALVAEDKKSLDEDKYTELGLNVKHTLNMAQTFWYKLGGKVKVDQKKYAKLEADYVKRGKVTVKLDKTGQVIFKNVMHSLTFKDKSKAMFHVSDKAGTPTVIGSFDSLSVNGKKGNMFHSAIKDRDLDLTFTESIEEAVSGSTLSILKKVGFKEAPVDNATTKVVNSLSGKKLKLTQLFGISMRAGKWADIFVGSTEDGKYFVVDPSGTTIFNKESELVTTLKSAALGESINHFLKGGKDLNDIVG